MTADELIARLEAASQGSRELDLHVAKAIGHCPNDAWLELGNDEVHWYEVHSFGSAPAYEPLSDRLAPYTTSLDAALTLVPEGWHVIMLNQQPDGMWFCAMHSNKLIAQVHSQSAFTDYNKPAALAVCIAALKARAAMGEKR